MHLDCLPPGLAQTSPDRRGTSALDLLRRSAALGRKNLRGPLETFSDPTNSIGVATTAIGTPYRVPPLETGTGRVRCRS